MRLCWSIALTHVQQQLVFGLGSVEGGAESLQRDWAWRAESVAKCETICGPNGVHHLWQPPSPREAQFSRAT